MNDKYEGERMMISYRFIRPIVVSMIMVCLIGCGTINRSQPDAEDTLRVGINSTYPPLIFKQGNKISGVEADFAREMAKALGKQLVWVELKWNKLIPALLNGKINIIMSGMSITDARKMQITFSDPYLETGQMALIRHADVKKYNSPESIKTSNARIGVEDGTTGDVFVQKNCQEADKISISNPNDAMFYFEGNRIDIFIYDAPAVMWLASANEADVTPLWTLLTDEQLAWGLRRQDSDLLASVNNILAQWKQEGKLDSILERWIPASKRLKK